MDGISFQLVPQEIGVSVLFLVTYLNHAPLFERCEVMCGSKNGHQKTCSREIGLYVQVLSVVLSSIMTIIGETYMHM